MTVWGYVRVSSESQRNNGSLENQNAKLLGYGIAQENIKWEVGSASKNATRTVLEELINSLAKDDLFIVVHYDRFCRSTLDGLLLIERIGQKGALFRALDVPHTGDAVSDKMFMIFSGFMAETEINRKRERQQEGIARAKKRGVYTGRKPSLDEAKLLKVQNLLNQGLTISDVSRLMSVSRSTLYKYLQTERKVTVKKDKLN